MLLRRVTKHVTEQNWFAVFIDFFIVVVGVFIGIQVANWNDERAFKVRETELLIELKGEVENSIVVTDQKINAYIQVTAAAKRSLDFIANDKPCGTDCWDVLVDFMHASQWQDIRVRRTTYEGMRLLNLPKNKAIIDETEAYMKQNENNALTFDELPQYRSLVRQLVPIAAQEYYWAHCYSFVDGIESYVLNCPEGVSDENAAQIVKAIDAKPAIKLYLTEWTGAIVSIPTTFGDQNVAARRAIEAIDAELERRQ